MSHHSIAYEAELEHEKSINSQCSSSLVLLGKFIELGLAFNDQVLVKTRVA